jgi:hypothetical protein
MESGEAPTIRNPDAKPTPKQIYALAHELSKRAGEVVSGNARSRLGADRAPADGERRSLTCASRWTASFSARWS